MGQRPYGIDCIDSILTRRAAQIRRQLVAMATGLGKTYIFAHLPDHMPKGKQMSVVAHRIELIEQAANEIAGINPHLNIGIEMGKFKADGREDVIVGSVQTMQGDRLQKIDPARAYWLNIDEAHHAIAGSHYDPIIEHHMANPECTLVGWTATPNRADGIAMGSTFEEIVYQYDMLAGIQDGWLSDVHGFILRTGTDISKVGNSKGDFKEKEISNAVNTSDRNEAIVKGWLEHCWPRQTMVFTVNVQHAKDLCDTFLRQGIRAAYSWGEDRDRKVKLGLLMTGQLEVLINCALWIEGFNYKNLECIIPACPTKSQSKLIQMVGRGTRLGEGIGNLVEWRNGGLLKDTDKQNCLVMDPVDVFGKHSLATLPSLFGMSPTLDLQGASVVAAMMAIKKAGEAFPNADLTKLEALSDLDTFVHSVDIWKVRFAEEVAGFAGLQWTKSNGGYRIVVPRVAKDDTGVKGDGGYFNVTEDLVGKFSIDGRMNGSSYEVHQLTSLSDAVTAVEKTITADAPETLYLLGREARWMKGAVSAGQMVLLEKLKVPATQIAQMNKGQAAAFLTQRFDRQLKGK